MKFPEDDLPNSIGTFGAVLKFIVKDCDPATGLPDIDEGDGSLNKSPKVIFLLESRFRL